MNDDDFTTAARAEAESLVGPYAACGPMAQGYHDGHAAGAEWARARLAAQEPTDAEAEAAARSVHEHFPRKYVDEFGYICTARWRDLEPCMQEAYLAVARAALSAARKARP